MIATRFEICARLGRSDRGATAVEYAVIAGLIGLGIVGSLVTTKTSLNAVFGKTASQMGQGQATAPTSTSTQNAYWGAKTLSGPPTVSVANGVTMTAYKYTDGTAAYLQRGFGGWADTRLTITDKSDNTNHLIWANVAGQQTLYEIDRYTDSTMTTAYQTQTGDNNTNAYPGNPPAPPSEQVVNISGGRVTSNSNGPASAAFIALSQTGNQDLKYFQDITPK